MGLVVRIHLKHAVWQRIQVTLCQVAISNRANVTYQRKEVIA